MISSRISSLLQNYRHLLTLQNISLVVLVVIALSWVWGAVGTLQKNYQYQRQVDANAQQIELIKLQNQNFHYQQAYYRSAEFLELSARAKLNKALPGERLVLLPSSEGVKDTTAVPTAAVVAPEESNLTKWLKFFFDVH